MILAKNFSAGALAIAATAVLALSGCGGGGGDIGSSGQDRTPIINTQPIPAAVTSGESVTFAVGADGDRLHYTWLRDGQPIVGGPDQPRITFNAGYKDANHLFSVLVVNTAGQVTSAGAKLTLLLTPDEQLFEAEVLNGGYYTINWRLSSGPTQTPGEDFLYGQQTTLPYTPLIIGSATSQEAFQNLTNTLPFSTDGVTPELIDDTYVDVSNFASGTFDYDINGIEEVTYAAVSATATAAGPSNTRTGYTFTPLSGPLSATPSELQLLFNVVFSNPNVLDQTVTWQPGSGYLTYTEVASNDQFTFQDCYGQPPSTVNGAVTFCSQITALGSINETMMKGIYDPVHNVNHVLADGAVTTIGGASVWTANTPNVPSFPGETVTFLAYSQSTTGDVAQGIVVHAGERISGNDLETLPGGVQEYPAIHFRLNPAAFASLKAASKL